MKEKGTRFGVLVMAAWMGLAFCAMPAAAAEAEKAIAEGTSGQLEWFALGASSLWALLLQLLRLRK